MAESYPHDLACCGPCVLAGGAKCWFDSGVLCCDEYCYHWLVYLVWYPDLNWAGQPEGFHTRAVSIGQIQSAGRNGCVWMDWLHHRDLLSAGAESGEQPDAELYSGGGGDYRILVPG